MSPSTQQNWWRRLNRQFGGSRPGRWLGPRVLHHADSFLEKISGGRWTLTELLSGATPVWLTSTGAKSGQARTIPLIGLRDGERVILVASNWGQPHYPAWYYNLRANPQVEVRMHRQTRPYTARQASDAGYDHYWALAVDYYPGYAIYKTTTQGRPIPIFVLEPR